MKKMTLHCKEEISFKKKMRPADHLFILKTVCFVDFKKAFNSVWRTGLFYKVIVSKIDPNIIKMLRKNFEKTSQSLNITDHRSQIFFTTRGVIQSCILSPKLFNLFINDILSIFNTECKPVRLGKEAPS